MNSSLSILLRWRPHRILSKIITTQTLNLNTFQVIPIINKTTRKQNLFYSTLPDFPDCEFRNDLRDLRLFLFLNEASGRNRTAFDLWVPVIDRLTRFKSVETLISDLQSRGFLNDFESFLPFLSLLSYADKNEVLIDAYHHMVKSHGFVPNTFALNLLVDSLFKTSQPLVALSVLEQMNSIDYYSDNVTFNMLLFNFCKMEDDKNDFLPQVYQLLGLKVKLGLKFSIHGWTSIIHKCCKSGRLHDAIKFFYNMTQTDCSSSVIAVTHTVLIKAFLDSNKVDDAVCVLVDVGNEGIKPDKHSFARIVTALCAQGRLDLAVIVYRAIAKEYPNSDIHLDNHIPVMIMSELMKAGMSDKAATLLTLAVGEL